MKIYLRQRGRVMLSRMRYPAKFYPAGEHRFSGDWIPGQ